MNTIFYVKGFWKNFRIVFSLALFLIITFIFIDFRQLLSASWYNVITYLQFVPSFRKFLFYTGFASAGFIFVILFSLLVGRVYCSFICPLGTLQDILIYLSRKIQTKRKRFKYRPPQEFIRFTFLALTVIPLFFTSIWVLYLLDPYSNFGRIASDIGTPVFHILNNTVAHIFIHLHIFIISPIDIPQKEWAILLYPLGFLFIIILFTVRSGRLFCNTVCPVGTVLALISKISWFKIQMDKSSCTKCAKCAVVCKSQCISVKDQKLDFSRCVGCMNCIHVCETNSIRYRISKNKFFQTEKSQVSDISKRRFLKGGLMTTGILIAIPSRIFSEGNLWSSQLRPVPRKFFSTPPGSKNLNHFNSACTSCHLCIEACPGKVLQPSATQFGIGGFLQPFMDFKTGYCQYNCTKCGEVCPTGAIFPLKTEEKKLTQRYCAFYKRKLCCIQ